MKKLCVTLSLVMALLNSIGFFAAYVQKPVNTVYLGTIHYWEDYFLYLNHFYQGANGAWLTINRFTTEITSPSIVYWSNVLLGKLGSLINLSPVVSYNASVIILSFFVLIGSYVLLRTRIFPNHPKRALVAFIFATLSTSLINYVKGGDGAMIFWPFQIWRTPHFAFDRLGGAPHQLMQTLLFYGTVFFLFAPKTQTGKKERITTALATVFGVLLATINPVQAAFLFVCALAVVRSIPLVRFLAASACTAIAVLGISQVLNSLPHVQSKLWEATQQGATTIPFLILSIGPMMVLLAAIGFVKTRKTFSPIEWFGFLTIIIGYALFLSPVPGIIGISNMRFLFPASAVFWGSLAARGTKPVFLMLFLLTVAPTLFWELSQKMQKPGDATNPLVYLPKDASAAFSSLAQRFPYDDIVLANPTTHMDTLVPALSGHTTYSGHMLATIANSQKQQQSGQFFSGHMTEESAVSFLRKNAIKYVVTTTKDETDFIVRRYPFLKTDTLFGDSAAIFYD